MAKVLQGTFIETVFYRFVFLCLDSFMIPIIFSSLQDFGSVQVAVSNKRSKFCQTSWSSSETLCVAHLDASYLMQATTRPE